MTALGFVAAVLLTRCSAASIQPAVQTSVRIETEALALESTEPYRRAGFLVGEGAIPFVGMVRYFGTESLDTTLVVVALSIPPRSLSFVRAGDRYAAYYAVKIDIMAGQTLIRTERPTGEVRVASLQETTRGDEGVIFQRMFRIAPGGYSIRIAAQDSLGSGAGTATGPISVPYMADGVVAPILPVFAAEPRANRRAPMIVVANPRSTVRYGRDTAVQFYLEAYGPNAPDTILVTSRPDRDESIVLRRDTVVFPRTRDPRPARLAVPIAGIGLGLVRFLMTRTNGSPVGAAAATISIGEEAPVSTFDELLDALKYYATDSELRVLRNASSDQRPALWAAFKRQTDPNPSTPENEALHEYFRRVSVANALYREDARPPWLTDRGAVVLALGEPDMISEPVPADSTSTARLVTWEYRRHRLLLTFSDQTGFGPWGLTPASDADFRSFLSIAGPCIGCR